jgi:hypothetical protein
LGAILNSSPIKEQLHLVGRSYGGDTVKLEPREMDKLPILDPRLLDDDEVRRVNLLFEALCETPLDEEVSRLIYKYEGQAFEDETRISLF